MKTIQMFTIRVFVLIILGLNTAFVAFAQDPTPSPAGPNVGTVEVGPSMSEAEVGQKKQFTVTAKD